MLGADFRFLERHNVGSELAPDDALAMGGTPCPEIKTEFLFKIILEAPPPLDLDETSYAEGASLAWRAEPPIGRKGDQPIDSGRAWLQLRPDDVLQLDVRHYARNRRNKHIYMSCRGYYVSPIRAM